MAHDKEMNVWMNLEHLQFPGRCVLGATQNTTAGRKAERAYRDLERYSGVGPSCKAKPIATEIYIVVLSSGVRARWV